MALLNNQRESISISIIYIYIYHIHDPPWYPFFWDLKLIGPGWISQHRELCRMVVTLIGLWNAHPSGGVLPSRNYLSTDADAHQNLCTEFNFYRTIMFVELEPKPLTSILTHYHVQCNPIVLTPQRFFTSDSSYLPQCTAMVPWPKAPTWKKNVRVHQKEWTSLTQISIRYSRI